LILIALVAITFAQTLHSDPARSEFIAFQHQYGKIYASAVEFESRFQIFKENIARAQELSSRDPHAQYGVTKFMDLTPEEFKNTILMKTPIPSGRAHKNVFAGDLAPIPEGTTFDWRNKGGVVTPVYNQGQCGSCWAFSITENIESQWALAGNALTSLSMQQVVSCDTNDDGCGGGDPPTAYQYVMEAGLESYNAYPYQSGEGESGSCQYNQGAVVAHIQSYTTIGSEQQAQSYLTQNGPLSVCVDAESWQYYTGGIITTESNCGTSLDHCVMITGYGVESGVNYWWVRNSWGTDWGQAGYLQVESGADVCGIAQEITSATGA
jgi:C1A family cysteine protease